MLLREAFNIQPIKRQAAAFRSEGGLPRFSFDDLYRIGGHGGKKHCQFFTFLSLDPYSPEPVVVLVGSEHAFHHGGTLPGYLAVEYMFRLGVFFGIFLGKTVEYTSVN